MTKNFVADYKGLKKRISIAEHMLHDARCEEELRGALLFYIEIRRGLAELEEKNRGVQFHNIEGLYRKLRDVENKFIRDPREYQMLKSGLKNKKVIIEGESGV